MALKRRTTVHTVFREIDEKVVLLRYSSLLQNNLLLTAWFLRKSFDLLLGEIEEFRFTGCKNQNLK